eukprot:1486040-Ditylum_brightwellii.AAC.1
MALCSEQGWWPHGRIDCELVVGWTALVCAEIRLLAMTVRCSGGAVWACWGSDGVVVVGAG